MSDSIVFISDIHGNIVAFREVLKQLDGADIFSLGDTVGYGPYPAQCVDAVIEHCSGVIQGNHDAAVAEEINYNTFSPPARRSAEWTREQLSARQINYLRNLPLSLENDNFKLFHGSPSQPLRQYIETPTGIRGAYSEAGKPGLLALGHTHKPYLYLPGEEEFMQESITPGKKIAIPPGGAVLNPGSVGQPRDGDPRACFARYRPRTGELVFQRVDYDIDKVSAAIKKEKLPSFLGERLREGY